MNVTITAEEKTRLLNALDKAEATIRDLLGTLDDMEHRYEDADRRAQAAEARARKGEVENKALRHLVNCHDNYLIIVDRTTAVPPEFLRLEDARARLEELERGNADECCKGGA